MLSALIRKKEIAIAKPATKDRTQGRTVEKVASVVVANQIFPEEESAIRGWLRHINETDPAIIDDLMTKLRVNAEARAYCLEQPLLQNLITLQIMEIVGTSAY
jgi:hypothetical protein